MEVFLLGKKFKIKAVSKIKQGEKIFPEDRFFSVDMKTITNPAKLK